MLPSVTWRKALHGAPPEITDVEVARGVRNRALGRIAHNFVASRESESGLLFNLYLASFLNKCDDLKLVAKDLQRAGVEVDVDDRPTLVGAPASISAPEGVNSILVWRTAWAGVIWSLWRAYNGARHGEPFDLQTAWLRAKAVWKDARRIVASRRKKDERRAESGDGGGSLADNDLWDILLRDFKQDRPPVTARHRPGGRRAAVVGGGE